LLLQNWWEGKQFLEMTLEHLESGNAELIFPMQEHTKARELLNAYTTQSLFTEADIDDGGDIDEGSDEDDDELDESSP
jgi:hypothetical protein